MANGQKLKALKCVLENLLVLREWRSFPLPLLEARLADAEAQLHRYS